MKNYFLLILGFMQLSFSVAQTQNTSIFKQEWAWLGLDFSQVKLVGAEGFSDLPQIKDYYFDQWNLLMYTENSKYNIPNNMGFLKKRNINSILKAQSKATMNIFKLKNIPFRHFIFNKNDEEELGMIFTFFVLETILLARLMNVNPFNQPAVEQVKIETGKILSR